jgi:hypothetical protein
MNLVIPAFGPAAPEILILAGALLLLFVGALRGERIGPVVDGVRC